MVSDSGLIETVEALEIDVDPTMIIETKTGRGETEIHTFDRSIMHITVGRDPEVPESWVILRIEEERETD